MSKYSKYITRIKKARKGLILLSKLSILFIMKLYLISLNYPLLFFKQNVKIF